MSALPVDLLFGLTEPLGPVSHKGYAEKWCKRMIEASEVANQNSLSSSSKGKSFYDKKARRHNSPCPPHSWTRRIMLLLGEYVVKEQVVDKPVYVIHPEGNGQVRTRTLYRNLLLLVSDLPVGFPQQPATPALKSKQRHAKARVTVQKSRNRMLRHLTQARTQEGDIGYEYHVQGQTSEQRVLLRSKPPIQKEGNPQGKYRFLFKKVMMSQSKGCLQWTPMAWLETSRLERRSMWGIIQGKRVR